MGKLKTEHQVAGDGTDDQGGDDFGGLRTAPPHVPPDWVDAKGRKEMSEEERRAANRSAGEDEERASEEMSLEDQRGGLRMLDREVGDSEDDEDEGNATDEPPAKATRSRKKKA